MQFRENIKAMYSVQVSSLQWHNTIYHKYRWKVFLATLSSSSFSLLSSELYQKPTIGYKGLMTSYQNKVIHLADDKQKGEIQLVVNLFQSVLDGFIRGEMKKEEAEPAKVIIIIIQSDNNDLCPDIFKNIMYPWLRFLCVFQPAKARKKRRKKDKSVRMKSLYLPVFFTFVGWIYFAFFVSDF